MGKKIVIVGGVAGGATAAARLRRLDETAEIIMFEKGEYISFANCGLPYYIGGSIEKRSKLLLQTVEGMSHRFQMDIRNLSEVVKINRQEKTVTVKNLRTNEQYEESYDTLILSPGAKPIRPAIPGIDEAENVFTLRNIPDTDKIKNYVDTHSIKRAVVVGGGFIGVEMAENLWDLGIEVSLVEMGNQIMAPVDYEMAAILHDHMSAKGVNLVLEDGVKAFQQNGSKVVLNSGTELETDMIVLAIGVTPESSLAKDAGLETGVRNTIVVNDTLQTADENIYAIGDAIQVKDYINKQPTMIPLAWPANRQGRLVADHINGKDVSYKGTVGTSIAKVFDLTVASTGNNEKTLTRLGIDYEVVHVHPNSHAGYYPGAAPIALKLIFNREGKILGAQAVGADGVDKRIDVIATAIQGNLTVFDLPDLELSYAPPYSSAKDPVNMAGYVASNILEENAETVQWHEIDEIVANGGLLIDVREPIEREGGIIPGSINIPLGEIREKLSELSKDQVIYVSCQVGLRGYVAARILMQHGFQVKNVDGGYKTYKYTKPAKKEGASPLEKAIAETAATTETKEIKEVKEIQVDACGLQCPGPILKVKETIDSMKDGEVLHITASDFGFASDIQSWCENTNNTFISASIEGKTVKASLQKGSGVPTVKGEATVKDGSTMVVFSQDLDRALASFIIASGAAAMGKEVTMFFTFWGLNVIKKENAPKVEKDGMEKMFSMMMPNGPSSLPISNMNFGGMGSKMIQHVMHQKNVDSLQMMIEKAQQLGIKLVACTMSMDIMGIKKEELLDGVEYGGVATYLGDTEKAGLNLFI